MEAEMKQGARQQPDPDDPRGVPPGLKSDPGLGGTMTEVFGALVHGDAWPEVRERQKRIAEDQLRAAKRRADLDAFGTVAAYVFLVCLIVTMVAGTGWLVAQVFG